MSQYIVALDQGTSSTRAMLYDVTGKLMTSSQYTLTQYYPKKGWVEHDPEEIWQTSLQAVRDVVADIPPEQWLCLGLTNQRETTLCWDKKTGRCLSPAIVWQDRRTEDFCRSLEAHQDEIRQKTGLVLDPYFSATKMHWMLNHVPDAAALADMKQLAFGTVDSFLLWRLSKGRVHATDITNASRTMLYDIYQQQWDDALLSLFNIPLHSLPEVHDCDAHVADIDAEWFGRSIPVTGVAGDQQAALVGQACFEAGMTKATFGTGGFLLMNTGKTPVRQSDKLLSTIAYQLKGETCYGLEGSIYHAGTTIKWLRDELKIIKEAHESESLAASLKSNDGVYLVSSFTGLGAPHWISQPSAMIVGLSRMSDRAHFARAALEGVCYQVKDVLDCMQNDSAIIAKALRVDGGMAVNNWMLQFLADLCRIDVERPFNVETTAHGAAVIAALGIGLIDNIEQAKTFWMLEQKFHPEEESGQFEQYYAGWQKALRMILAAANED